MTDDELREREQALFDETGQRPREGLTVIRLRADRLDLETFTPLFVDVLGLIKADATHLCHQESGIVLDNVEAALAQKLAAALQAAGEECFVVAAAKLVSVSRPRPVTALRFTKAGLALGGATGEKTQVGWDEPAVLALSHVPIEHVTHKTTGNPLMANVGIGAALGGLGGAIAMGALNPATSTRTVKSSDLHQYLDLLNADGTLYFRIEGRQFDYSILGDQLQAGSTANLLTLTRWLLTYMPGLRTNLDAERLKTTGTAPLPVHSPHGLSQVSQWLLNLAKFGKHPLPPREQRQY